MRWHPDMSVVAWVRRLLVIGGVVMIGLAFRSGEGSLLMTPYLKFVVKVTLATLFVVLPLTLAVGWLIGKVVPVVARPVVQGSVMATALIVGIALPSVLGRGRQADMPSALPRDYATGLWSVLAVVWAVSLALIVVRIVRRRTRLRSQSQSQSQSQPRTQTSTRPQAPTKRTAPEKP